MENQVKVLGGQVHSSTAAGANVPTKQNDRRQMVKFRAPKTASIALLQEHDEKFRSIAMTTHATSLP